MKQARFYIIMTLLAIVVLSVVRVVVTNNISTNGIDLAKIEQQTADLKKQNALLHEQILELSSLNHIDEKATEDGFVESKIQMVLSTPLPIALNQ